MYTRTYKIADRVIEITSMYETVHQLCCDYQWESGDAEKADFSIDISQADIDYEREKSAREDEVEGKSVRNFSDAYLETLAVYRKIADIMLQYDTLLFHGSVVAVDGVGYLFTAKSGTGKSTHTRLWRELFGKRAIMVNDDKPLLKITADGVYACGTPWDGKHRLSTNTIVPLKAICILERGEENQIQPVTAKEALPMLLQQSHRPDATADMIRKLTLVDALTKKVNFYKLHCNMQPEAAQVAFGGMQGKDL